MSGLWRRGRRSCSPRSWVYKHWRRWRHRLAYSISGSSVYYAGGGGGSQPCPGYTPGSGGSGGGGAGGNGYYAGGVSGGANTGGGGGGDGGSGGSGVVILAYPNGTMAEQGGTVTHSGGDTIVTFTSSGTLKLSTGTKSQTSNYLYLTLTNSQSSPTGPNFQQMITFNPSTYNSYEASDLGNLRFYESVTTPTVSYVPITLTNTQASATGSNFQQKISFNPSSYSSHESSDLGNIRFYGTAIQGGTSYVPITLTNSQSSPTGSNFAQMVSFNPSSYSSLEASDLGNIRFYAGSTELYSWCESGCSYGSTSAVFWINLPSGIGANSNIVVNMTFGSVNTEYDGVYAGEAPQQSNTVYVGQFDGSSSYVNLGNPSALQITGSMTISMWIYPTSFSNRENVYCKSYGGEGCITQETDGSLSYYYGTAGSNSEPYEGYNPGAKVTLNSWNHVVIVRNLQTMQLTWYVNGVASSPTSASYSSATASSLNAEIGAGYVYNYPGMISDVQVYNTALTSPQVTTLYSSGLTGSPIPSAGNVGWWPLDGNANDYSGSGNNGAATSVSYPVYTSSNYSAYDNGANVFGSIYSQICPINGNCRTPPNAAALFDGTSGWISVPSPSGLPTGSVVTVTAWVDPNPSQPSSCGSYCGILSYGARSCSPAAQSVLMSVQASSFLPSMATWCNDYVPGSGTALSTNAWNFEVLTISGTTAALYVNGQLSSSGTMSSSITPNFLSENLAIGSTDYPGRWFRGAISNVQIYGSALDPTTINALYDEGIGGAPLSGATDQWQLNGNAADSVSSNGGSANGGVSYPYLLSSPPSGVMPSTSFGSLSTKGGTASKAELYSWCESGCTSGSSSAVFWVSVPTGINASSSVVVNMTFEPTSTEYDGIYAGEAPQLSGTYGQYDNGANVFNFYDDFAGTSLNSALWTSSGSVTVNDGVTIAQSSGGISSTTSYNPQTNIYESYEKTTGDGSNVNLIGIGQSSSGDSSIWSGYLTTGYSLINWNPSAGVSYQSMGVSTGSTNHIFSLWQGPTADYGSVDYGTTYSESGSFIGPSTSTAISSSNVGGSPIIATWDRIRNMPPAA